MGFFRKKPVVIEARQLVGVAGETFDVMLWVSDNGYPWLIGDATRPDTLRPEFGEDTGKGIYIRPADGAFMIRTLEGDMAADYGDWIIRGVHGEFYPCKPHIFEETYEEV